MRPNDGEENINPLDLSVTATSFFLPNQKLAKQPCNSNYLRDFKPLLFDKIDHIEYLLYGFN